MLSSADLAAVAAVAFVASFAQGVTGFGSALVAMPLLAAFLEVRVASPITALLSLVVNALLLLPARRRLPWARILPLLAGALVGIPCGVFFLTGTGERPVRAALGAVLALSSVLLARGARLDPGAGRSWSLGAGALSGLLGGAFNTSGPPILIYAAARGWGKDETYAALQLYFLASGAVIALWHASSGLTTPAVLSGVLAGLPGLAFGAVAGQAAHRRVGEERFRAVLRYALLAAGCALLADALRP